MKSSTNLPARLQKAWDGGAVLLKAISFGLIGVVNSGVDFAIFMAGYYVFNLPIITSNIISWSVAVTGSYVMNSMITFAKESGRQLGPRQYASFVLMQSLGFFANTATVWCMVEIALAPAWMGKIVAAGTSFVVNFTLTHLVVFRSRGSRKPR